MSRGSRGGGRRAHGQHAVRALLERSPAAVAEVVHLQGRRDARLGETLALAQGAGTPLRAASRSELDALAGGGNHQGVVAVLAPEKGASNRRPTGADARGADGEGGAGGGGGHAGGHGAGGAATERSAAGLLEWLSRPDRPAARAPLVLVLDGVQDPHNLGACLRTADAAGADAVLVPKDGAVGLTATVRKVACGAAESVPLFRATNLGRALDELKRAGFWLHGAAGDAAATLWDVRFEGPCAVLCGAEGRGLRRLTRERCDALFRVPMVGTVESLNVSVAAGVALFEVQRQRTTAARALAASGGGTAGGVAGGMAGGMAGGDSLL